MIQDCCSEEAARTNALLEVRNRKQDRQEVLRSVRLCLSKTLSWMTRGWAYGNETADGRVSDPSAACYPVAIYEASAA